MPACDKMIKPWLRAYSEGPSVSSPLCSTPTIAWDIIYTKQGQNDQALEAYRQALRVNPNHAECLRRFGGHLYPCTPE